MTSIIQYLSKPLPYCWICRQTLSDSGGQPTVKRHEHHVIPRAYGGSDGPTITLCSGDHSLMHDVALKLINGKSHFTLTAGLKPEPLSRLLYLATRVQVAHDYASNDANKKFPIVVGLDRKTNEMLKELVKFKRVKGGRQAVIRELIVSEFNRVFLRR